MRARENTRGGKGKIRCEQRTSIPARASRNQLAHQSARDEADTYYHPISYHIRRKNPLFSGSVRVVVKPLRIDQCFPETSVREQRLKYPGCWLIIMYFYNVLAWIYLLFVILYGCF